MLLQGDLKLININEFHGKIDYNSTLGLMESEKPN